jgi:hypothetical protein
VPTSTPPGTYDVGLRCGGGNVGVFASVHVTAQVQQVPTGAPQAGMGGASSAASPDGWIASGVIASLVAAGFALLAISRRRRVDA